MTMTVIFFLVQDFVYMRYVESALEAHLVAFGQDDEVHRGPVGAAAQRPLESHQSTLLTLLRRDFEDHSCKIPEFASRHLTAHSRKTFKQRKLKYLNSTSQRGSIRIWGGDRPVLASQSALGQEKIH